MSKETRGAEWYDRNRDGQKARMRDQSRALKADLVARKGGKCHDCGGLFNPVVYHFDHRDPFAKVGSVMTLARGADVAAFEAELEKCDLVCANCHAIRTSESDEVKAKITAGRIAATTERMGLESVLGPYNVSGALLHDTVVGRFLPMWRILPAVAGALHRSLATGGMCGHLRHGPSIAGSVRTNPSGGPSCDSSRRAG